MTAQRRQDLVLVELLSGPLSRVELETRIGAPVSGRCMRGLDVGGFVTRNTRSVGEHPRLIAVFTITEKGRQYTERLVRRTTPAQAATPWQKSDAEVLDWVERNRCNVQLYCWDSEDPGAEPRGWSIECDNEDVGRGLTLRMAVSDAIHHPERLTAALAARDTSERGG